MSFDNTEMMVANLAEYIYNANVGFMVEAQDAFDEGYKKVLIRYEESDGTYTDPIFMESWGNDIEDDMMLYDLTDVLEHSAATWSAVEALNRSTY